MIATYDADRLSRRQFLGTAIAGAALRSSRAR